MNTIKTLTISLLLASALSAADGGGMDADDYHRLFSGAETATFAPGLPAGEDPYVDCGGGAAVDGGCGTATAATLSTIFSKFADGEVLSVDEDHAVAAAFSSLSRFQVIGLFQYIVVNAAADEYDTEKVIDMARRGLSATSDIDTKLASISLLRCLGRMVPSCNGAVYSLVEGNTDDSIHPDIYSLMMEL